MSDHLPVFAEFNVSYLSGSESHYVPSRLRWDKLDNTSIACTYTAMLSSQLAESDKMAVSKHVESYDEAIVDQVNYAASSSIDTPHLNPI